jgi:hypothetical protein
LLRIVTDAWILWRDFFCHSLTWPTLIGFSYTALGELQLLFQIPPTLLPGSQYYRLPASTSQNQMANQHSLMWRAPGRREEAGQGSTAELAAFLFVGISGKMAEICG